MILLLKKLYVSASQVNLPRVKENLNTLLKIFKIEQYKYLILLYFYFIQKYGISPKNNKVIYIQNDNIFIDKI